MKFKGTIVITDPCYLRHDSLNSYEYWEKSGYGEDLSVFGCSQWISEDTIYGDWSCTTYKGDKEKLIKFFKKASVIQEPLWEDYATREELLKVSDAVYEELDELKKSYEFVEIGSFCADSGMVCVVYLDEVLKVNSTFKQWAKEHTWCVTIIEDFDGEVRYEIDDEGEAHIVGEGNINFYTVQTGI